MSLLSLNGKWNYILDPRERFSISDIINQNSFKSMTIPTNWEKANIHNYSGVVWFTKTFKVGEKFVHERISTLKFFGVDYFADVWINSHYLGKHEGYFQEFDFDVSDKLIFGKPNQIIVKVNSPKEEPKKVWPLKKQLIKGIFNHHDCRPGGWSFEYGQDQNTGGIWNDVEIRLNEEIFIKNIKITPKIDESYKSASVKIEINYRTQLFESTFENLLVEIQTPGRKIIKYLREVSIKPEASNLEVVFEIKNPELWWSWDLGKQNVYTIDISLGKQKLSQETFAIRKVELLEGDRFLLNGKELFLRGTNIIPAQFLSELNYERIKKIVELIKEANINAVRVHAHVNRKELYKEFDKQGIIIWQDFSLQWTYEDSPKFAENAIQQIKDMVNLLYNHPSICFWCCHNEPGEQINTLDNLLKDAIISQDQSRIIRLASNYEEHPYDGWYWGNKEHFAATPMGPMVTEFGAQALPSKKSLQKFIPKEKLFPPDLEHWKYHNFQPDTTFNIAKVSIGNNIDEFVDNSQKYQSELLSTAIHFYRRAKNNGITGIFQFMFIDCWPSITWSVVDYYLVKKKGFQTLKECYSPVLLSVNLRQDQYFIGAKINFDFTIINDLYKQILNAKVVVKLNNEIIGLVDKILVNENSTAFRHFESLNINMPKKIKPGNYKLAFILMDKKKNISSTSFNIIMKNYGFYEINSD